MVQRQRYQSSNSSRDQSGLASALYKIRRLYVVGDGPGTLDFMFDKARQKNRSDIREKGEEMGRRKTERKRERNQIENGWGKHESIYTRKAAGRMICHGKPATGPVLIKNLQKPSTNRDINYICQRSASNRTRNHGQGNSDTSNICEVVLCSEGTLRKSPVLPFQ
ncbi:hypothetical protein M011DRAFT_287948 [Sporormia fimetaria CBS 119925]|uniref:Uncharacterized protein n=1 Tax=Sporormia fimetaria CBS 119925 TaxID=1340428 RepID=A0A6A6UXB5_9PLEO|nr:hypothetical protein M011DRAFT_287948 [Sporormia fimetaria CBS 119925]